MKYVLHRHRHRIAWLIFVGVLMAGAYIGLKNFVFSSGEIAQVENESQIITGRPSPRKVVSRTLSFGDVFWGRYIDDWAKETSNPSVYPFSGLSSFNRQEYDAWIANLECPLTDTYIPSAEQDKTLTFSCPKSYTAEAARWFTAFTLANNHSGNQETVNGFAQTQAELSARSIQYFGHFNPKQYNDLCEIVNLPARYILSDGTFKAAAMPIALCGMHYVFELPDDLALDQIRKYSKVLPTWVYGHMGTEYTTEPSDIQRQTYRSFIDAGADVVIGNHPHRVQTAESYKGKLIVYSLGNFIFDQLGAPEQGGYEVQRGMGLGIEITADINQSMLLWTQLSPECAIYDDGCIAKADYQGQTRPRYSYRFSIVTSDNSNRGVATKASEEWNKEVLQRLDWDNLVTQLNY